MDLLVPPLFGVGAAIRGYAQMIFGPEIVNAGIKRTQFKPVYIPTWIVDSVLSFTSHVEDSEHASSMHIREATLPGIHHHPLARWAKRFPDEIDIAKPFSEEYLEPLEGKHDILALPYSTSPLAISQALSHLPYGDLEVHEGWSVDPRSIAFKMVGLFSDFATTRPQTPCQLVAYPLLQPAYLSEFTMEDRNVTVLAHGHYDYFAVWGHPNHPDVWLGSDPSVVISYLRTSRQLKGGPNVMADFIDDHNTPNNLEKIACNVDMNDLRIQPLSSADATRNWMQIAAKVDEMKFIIDNIPANTNAHVIRIGPGVRISKLQVEGDARAPLQRQLKELEEEMEASKPDWLAKWDASSREHLEKPTT
ncbi:hypothetical protein FRC06_000565 [Ceratobasidium sp. 370]|nr:hypothetical protein FRC06_000565 [Ceratobasidium sp. 370]